MTAPVPAPTDHVGDRGGRVAAAALLAGFVALAVLVRGRGGDLAIDQRLMAWIVAHRDRLAIDGSRMLTHLGDPPVLLVVAVVTTVVLLLRVDAWERALVPAIALGAASAIEATTKVLVGRARPPVIDHLVTESDRSFPSGHSTGAMAFYLASALVIAEVAGLGGWRRRLVVAAGVLLAVAVGVSRLVLGVHWPTDVLAGWFLGAGGALATSSLAAPAIDAVARSHHHGRGDGDGRDPHGHGQRGRDRRRPGAAVTP